ncbi:DUF1028 domain-containing protein [Aliikangiella sp. IMCC44359]|uniref:DUF1028 domain-containing protein n=1 Tax=Aliikangiella sp. IMCC44359 TaxID=3459125 RepID=UPI00403ADD8C
MKIILIILIIMNCFMSELVFADPTGKAMRPAHTYSIVARDEKTGELGAAVQSHWFSVGSSVIWAEPGVGAVATQSFIDPSYGPLGLELMRAGKSATEALKGLLATDSHTNVRQVGMVDAQGHVANHTGKHAIIEHCQKQGKGFTVQANLMDKATVCEAMAKAYEKSSGDLAERIMAALEAAQKEGGDIRGQQSSALLVVSGDKTLPAWGGRLFDLRVEDHASPIKELRRLLGVARAYQLMTEGDDFMTSGDVASALKSYTAAEKLAPDNHEAVFWHAVTLASINRVDESLPLFKRAFKLWPKWRELVPRLPASELLPDDKKIISKILAQ